MRPLRKRSGPRHDEALDSQQVVTVSGHAFLEIEAPATETATLSDNHALRTGIWHGHLCGHRVRLIFDGQDRVLAQSRHACIEHLNVATNQLWSASQIRVEAFSRAVVEGKHIVLRRLDE